MNFCTLFNSKYLVNGLLLYESLNKYLPDFKLFVFTFDNFSFNYLKSLKLKKLILIKLNEFEDKHLLNVKKKRTPTEYFWTCTGSTILYLFNKFNLKDCTYLDSDIFFYSNPYEILNKVKKKSCLITKHNYSKTYDQSKTNGKFCVQFMYFKNNKFGKRILNDWREDCIEWCYNRVEDGKFGDQKYLDLWPKKYGKQIKICNQVGAGIAPWNSKDFNFKLIRGKIKLKNIKSKKKHNLIFFHFHELKFYSKFFVYIGNYKINKDCYDLIYKDYARKYLKKLNEIRQLMNINKNELFDSFGSGKIGLINLLKTIKNFKNMKNINQNENNI